MKISIAEVRRRLPVGATFTATFLRDLTVRPNVGPPVVMPNRGPSSREVVSQNAHEMVSRYTSGPRSGQNISCKWTGVTARVEDGVTIILSQKFGDEREDFLAITDIKVDAS